MASESKPERKIKREQTPAPAPGIRPRRGEVQTGIADADKRARTGSEHEQVRNTPPAGEWNDVA